MLKPAALVLLALPKPQQVHSLGKKTRILRVDMTTQELILAENAVKKNKQIYICIFSDVGVYVTCRTVFTPLCDTTPAQLPQSCIFSPLYETP